MDQRSANLDGMYPRGVKLPAKLSSQGQSTVNSSLGAAYLCSDMIPVLE